MAQTVQTDICNDALNYAQQDITITSIDESSVSARRCRRFYEPARQQALSSFPFPFVRKVVSLARIDSVSDEYTYSYAYPTDAIRIMGVYSSADMIKQNQPVRADTVFSDAVGRAIATDAETPVCVFIKDSKDEISYPPNFRRFFALVLAEKIANAAGTSDGTKNDIRSQMVFWENRAKLENVIEGDNIEENEDNKYVDVRG